MCLEIVELFQEVFTPKPTSSIPPEFPIFFIPDLPGAVPAPRPGWTAGIAGMCLSYNFSKKLPTQHLERGTEHSAFQRHKQLGAGRG